ncbi:cytochrome c [Variovorax sp. dw_954]|uniref:c-type cytochrome n=1 Tax=Variovorax sp. dw_954 TaxID=2720078 RepID=UPI001BD67D15|nr:cytochrome c [Variovorax sp. dw_954]
MNIPSADWVNPLIQLLEAVQLAVLRLLSWAGLAGASEGQAAWPWTVRLTGENLLIDLGQARRLAWTLGLLALAFIVLLLALLWRRRRWWLIATVPLLLLIAPWPDAGVLLSPAQPTSFHRSPTGFSAASISQGRALYAQHCVACHGADGRGGPLASAQPVWPPNLSGPLLWRRADGDVLWRILHGTHDRRGHATMPAFADSLDAQDAWALIDFMKANAAGQSLRATGAWAQPVALPGTTVRCDGRAPRALSSWRGQRVRIVLADASSALPLEDPRLATVVVRTAPRLPSTPAADCEVDDAELRDALALIAGSDALPGLQLIADRDGWLRARSGPGQAAWSEDDLICRTDLAPRAAERAPASDGLGALIARIDAEPVRFVKGGFIH